MGNYSMKKNIEKPAATTPRRNWMSSVLFLLLFVGLAAASYYFYDQYSKVKKEVDLLKKNPNSVAQKEADELVAKVGRLIELPKGEKPNVATIADKKKIKDQPFFKKAENGDKILLYVKARRAIIYRPSTDKIIEVGFLNVSQDKAKGSVAGEAVKPSPTVKPSLEPTTTPEASPTEKP
jgi:hypothetical protein